MLKVQVLEVVRPQGKAREFMRNALEFMEVKPRYGILYRLMGWFDGVSTELRLHRVSTADRTGGHSSVRAVPYAATLLTGSRCD